MRLLGGRTAVSTARFLMNRKTAAARSDGLSNLSIIIKICHDAHLQLDFAQPT